MGLPVHLVGLMQPAAYPYPVDGVQLIETPLSWVLIAGARAYKVKRPVRLAFVDQSDLARRLALCREELRLNRRFAPGLYHAVVAITGAGALLRVAGDGEPVEYAVEMSAFPAGETLDQLVVRQRADAGELWRFGGWLAAAHATLPRLDGAMAPAAARRAVDAARRNARQCTSAAAAFGTVDLATQAAGALGPALAAREALLARRAAAGRVRECHADLHLSNVVRIDGRLVPFDCLEFDPALRWIDIAEDVAFLHSDLLAYGAPPLAAAMLNGWLQAGGDYEACAVLRTLGADRALVRAKVLALRGDEPALRMRHRHYLELAVSLLQPARPRCVMLCGLPGAGKSWLAARLAAALPAVLVRSDIERRRLRTGYDDAGKATVYERLSYCADAALDGGLDIVVDANYGLRGQRAALAALCRARGVPLTVVHCSAPPEVLRERIVARAAGGGDASEADLGVLQRQREQREPIAADEALAVIETDTTLANVVPATLSRLRAVP